ncbi:signal peptidase II [Arthrobacter sp. TmT3-37]|uniref:signal peptidase II n=1 Tax=Arthrobacter sp. B1805 TaxID=2058892 RepID=UPI000CE329DA|nr:signal peptidase II [Arthrobacter sp. B1805]
MSEDEPAASAASRARKRTRVWMLVGSLILVGVDLAVKAIVELQLREGQTIEGGLVDLRLHFNPGVAFSFGADLPPIVILLGTGAIIVGLAWFLLASAPTLGRLGQVGGFLLLGGALGNLLDRLADGGVADYLHVSWFSTFNLADVFVSIGVGLLILGTLVGPRGRTPESHDF